MNLILYSSPTSPFVRRIHVALKRISIAYQFENVGNLFPPSENFLNINPLGLIPALKIENNEILIESGEILNWVHDKFGGIWPKDFEKCWQEKNFSLLCSGVMTQAVSWRLESVETQIRSHQQKTKEETILRTLNCIQNCQAYEKWEQTSKKHKNIEQKLQLAYQGIYDLGIALDYLNFRLPHLEWEKKFPSFNETLQNLKELEIFSSTAPCL
jgi:glutathione S-transferase